MLLRVELCDKGKSVLVVVWGGGPPTEYSTSMDSFLSARVSSSDKMTSRYVSDTSWYSASVRLAGMALTPSSWTLGGAGSSESGRMPLVREGVVERNLDVVVKGTQRARVVGAATARRGANRAARVVEVRTLRPTRPAALERDCLVILNGESGTIGLERRAHDTGDSAERRK